MQQAGGNPNHSSYTNSKLFLKKALLNPVHLTRQTGRSADGCNAGDTEDTPTVGVGDYYSLFVNDNGS